MLWFIAYNWLQLAVFFGFGFAAAWWLLGRAAPAPEDDVLMQLAQERTRRQEGEAERAKLRAQIAQLLAQHTGPAKAAQEGDATETAPPVRPDASKE